MSDETLTLKEHGDGQGDGVRLLLARGEAGSGMGLRDMLIQGPATGWKIRETGWGSVRAALEAGEPPDAAVFEFDASTEACAALQEVRSRLPHVPVIVVQFRRDPALALRLARQGVQDCLSREELVADELAEWIQCSIERKRTEVRRKRDEQKYHGIFNNLVEGVFQTSVDGSYLSANTALARIYGYDSPEELMARVSDIGRGLYVRPERRAEFVRLMEQNDVVSGFESEICRKDGTRIWISENCRAIRDPEGRLVCYEGTVEDITKKKRAEEQIRQANAELAASQQELRLRNEQMLADLAMARETQLAILPQQYPSFPAHAAPEQSRLHFCHLYEPTGTVGGDFFNVSSLSNSRAAIFICDVMGHGVRSALVTAMMRALVEELKELAHDPGQLLTRLNRDIVAMLRPTGTPILTTAICLLVDLDGQELLYANAGHPRPFLIRRRTSEILDLGESRKQMGPALGLFAEAEYATFRSPFTAPDTLMLFTDGLYEVEGVQGAFYDRGTLRGAVARNASLATPELFDRLLQEIRRFSVHQRFDDDVCLLGVDVAEPAREQ